MQGHACLASGVHRRHRPHASDMQRASARTFLASRTFSQHGVPVSAVAGAVQSAELKPATGLEVGRARPKGLASALAAAFDYCTHRLFLSSRAGRSVSARLRAAYAPFFA